MYIVANTFRDNYQTDKGEQILNLFEGAEDICLIDIDTLDVRKISILSSEFNELIDSVLNMDCLGLVTYPYNLKYIDKYEKGIMRWHNCDYDYFLGDSRSLLISFDCADYNFRLFRSIMEDSSLKTYCRFRLYIGDTPCATVFTSFENKSCVTFSLDLLYAFKSGNNIIVKLALTLYGLTFDKKLSKVCSSNILNCVFSNDGSSLLDVYQIDNTSEDDNVMHCFDWAIKEGMHRDMTFHSKECLLGGEFGI